MMRYKVFSLVLVLGTVYLACGAIRGGGQEGKDAAGAKLIGTWKLVSAKYGDEELNLEKLGITLKHVTPGNFVWMSYDPESKVISRSAGGTCTVSGEDYEETPQYGLGPDFEAVKNKPQKFTVKVDGDTWHHQGELSNGLKIHELWERQKAK